MTNNNEYIFICLSDICLSSSLKYCFSFCSFSNWSLVSLLLTRQLFAYSRYNFSWLASIFFPQFVAWFLPSSQNLFNCNEVQFIKFSFYGLCLWSQIIPVIHFSKSFTIVCLACMSIIYFELLLYKIWYLGWGSFFLSSFLPFICMWVSGFFNTIYWQHNIYFHWIGFAFLLISSTYLWVCVSGLFHWSVRLSSTHTPLSSLELLHSSRHSDFLYLILTFQNIIFYFRSSRSCVFP